VTDPAAAKAKVKQVCLQAAKAEPAADQQIVEAVCNRL
jgi:hypothetical protein